MNFSSEHILQAPLARRPRRRRWPLLAAALFAATLAFAWRHQHFGIAWYWLSMERAEARWKDAGIWLPAYRATIDARPVEGIADNASGLTFSPVTGTLFSVVNDPPQVVELSTDGRLLRTLPLTGIGDPEGIAHVRDELFVLTDERTQQLVLARITPYTTALDLREVPRLGLGLDLGGNAGFEGVSWDGAGDRLLVVKEKSPLRVIEIGGLPAALAGQRFDLQIREWRAAGPFLRDLSSLTYHEPTGHLLLLSDESRMVVEFDAEGAPVSMMPLWRGRHGLARAVPQAEGIAFGPDGALYLLSEPNLFYRFERAAVPAWAGHGQGR